MCRIEFCLLVFSISIIDASTLNGAQPSSRNNELKQFPSDFLFGAATSSYQIEGAWNEGGKGWSMWDHLVRTAPEHIADNTTGDVASNSYYFYKRDVQILKELGVNIYRFSISWPRILPYGRPDYVNREGVDYYNNLINELLANDITPFVTMYHWELPQNLNERGGWLTRDTDDENIIDWFGDYARVLYREFGDRVKHWLTINEPYIHCNHGYGYANHAPRRSSPGEGYYECGRNILLAHARAYHIYKEEFSQGGQVGIVLSCDWAMPSTDSEADAQAVLDYFDFHFGIYMDPIFSPQGNQPQSLIDRIANMSAAQGYSESRLRPFTEEQIDYMRGTSDFLALNHYTSYIVYKNESVNGMYVVPSHNDDAQIGMYRDPSWLQSISPWLYGYPAGLHNLLVYIKNKYNSPTIYITENGFSSNPGLIDNDRVTYYRGYLNAVLDALDDGVDVRGYCAWSLMDNFEWAAGFTVRFGLYQVDMNDPERPRTPRKSALYKEIIRSRVIDPEYNPDPYETDGSYVIKTSCVFVITLALLNIIL
ncbi:myrosinase 1-like isoform X2 [Leptidea sinapis]|uniref:myrosinase 1-like isoform X2 n=1 Tax=Leptidea sinapis TaxID=189913 RepID=UPI0021C3E3FC|nr:myrosinase 1-like isoform X2 [Leptidea sinapis]